MQLWNQNPTLRLPFRSGYVLTVLVSPFFHLFRKNPLSARPTQPPSENSSHSRPTQTLEKKFTRTHKKITPTLATVFPSAQMHFLNSLKQLSEGNNFKTITCKYCENHKKPKEQTHLKCQNLGISLPFCPPRTKE